MGFRRCLICLLVVVAVHFSKTEGNNRVRRGFCSLRNLDIANGDYSIRGGNSLVEYRCNAGFTLYGTKSMMCYGSEWSSDPPMCIASTCSAIRATATLRIEREFNGAVLKFSCSVLHKIVGADKLICDGKNWSDQVPTCEAYDPPTSCDFESGVDACGWFQHDKDEQDWVLNTGSTRTTRTGPTHDHTLGPTGDGHYMYFETSSPTRPSHKAIFESPLYPGSYSNKCFSFWYHIYGERDIGTLEVYIVPDGRVGTDGLTAEFTVQENLGDVWNEHNITLTPTRLPFQIWFVATRQLSYRSDFAIDDFKLINCKEESSTATASTVTSQPKSTTPRIVTNVTSPVVTTKTTTLRTTSKTSTKRPVVTTRSTNKPTTMMSTRSPTEPFHTTSQKSVTTGKKLSTQTTRSNAGTTMKPFVDTGDSGGKVAASRTTERNDAGKIAYILLSVGLVAAVAVAVIVGVYVYRRRHKTMYSSVGLSSENPLYNEIENQNVVVKFANQDENPYNECEY